MTQSIFDARNPVPQSTPQRMPHLKALTTVRAAAALYVGCFHMVRPFSLWGPLQNVMSAGYSGVSFFFFLSGFILIYTHGPEYSSGRGSAKRFWVARLARVYPLYFLVMLWAGYLSRASLFHPRYHIAAYVADLLMMQTWSIRMTPLFNIVAWSLSVEAFFYFIFPFVAARMQPRTLRRGLLFFAAAYLLSQLPAFAGLWWDPSAAWTETPSVHGPHMHMAVYALRRYPYLLAGQFLSGIAIGWLYLERPVSRTFGQISLVTGVGGIIAALFLSRHIPFLMLHNGVLIPFYALVVVGLCKPNIVSDVMSWAPLVLLGEASYAFYLIHFIFNDQVKVMFGWPETPAGLVPRLLILVPVSILLHLGVERPGRRLILNWWKNRQTPAVPAQA
jgi:peptidoglycan/LPS O-acetylase OafA/YrhL